MIINADAITGLRQLDDKSINTCITSPPYYGLRDYGVDGQIGLEPTPEDYIQKLVEVFREVKRVLKEDGTLWVNIGDSYWNKRSCNGASKESESSLGKSLKYMLRSGGKEHPLLKPKDLIGIPWMLAFALRNDGWYLRQDIIWSKPNPMPESVMDRCTKSHEYIFLLSKSRNYYFDSESISESVADSTVRRFKQDINSQEVLSNSMVLNGKINAIGNRYGGNKYTQNPDQFYRTKSSNAYNFRPNRNKRSVWAVSTARFTEAHFATFPPELIRPCILAGSPKSGVVLDPFLGSGTTCEVAMQEGRECVGIEINPEYCLISEKEQKSFS